MRRRRGRGTLLGHEFAELGLVHLHALFGGHLEGQLNREAVGVVQLEGVLAGHDGLGGIALGLVDGHVENRGAGLKGAAEGVFLAIRGFGHLMEGVVELRVAGSMAALEVGKRVGSTGSVTPSMRMERTVRRSRRRST